MLVINWFRGLGTLVFFAASLGLVQCSHKDSPPSTRDREIEQLIREADIILDNITQERLLSDNTASDRKLIQSFIYDIKVGLKYLMSSGDVTRASKIIVRSVQQIEKLPVLKRDRGTIFDFTRKANELLFKTAKRQKISLQQYTWNMYSYSFSEGLSPFGNYSKGVPWETGWAQDEYSYARVNGNDNRAWLLSPAFDLTMVKNPSFQFRHTFIINRGSDATNTFDRTNIMQKAFQVKISTHYQGGDPDELDRNADPNDNWQVLDISPLPSSIDFHTVNSPEIDLSDYAGKNVTVAFVFDSDSRQFGRHFLTWQIYQFDIFGQGELQFSGERESTLNEHKFNSNKLLPFQQHLAVKDGSEWQPFKRNNVFRYAKIESHVQQKPSDSWLLSPIYKIRDQRRLKLEILEAIKNPIFDQFEILASTNYKGGDPKLVEWTRLEHTPIKNQEPDRWQDNSVNVSLADYAGKDVVFAFHYVNDGQGQRGWEIESLRFIGVGDPIETANYSLEEAP